MDLFLPADTDGFCLLVAATAAAFADDDDVSGGVWMAVYFNANTIIAEIYTANNF